MFASQPPAGRRASAADTAITAVSEPDLATIAAYDRVPSGTDRCDLLRHLFGRHPTAAAVARRGGRVCGFVLARDGRRCAQIGPLVADEADIALALLRWSLASISGPVCLDVGDHHASLRAWLDANGFVPVTPFIRMIEGRSEPFDDPRRLCIIAGPELG
jgi:hypothetical protein